MGNSISFLMDTDEINVVKCEPWNSVKITFDLPTEAAQRLSELAELARRGDDSTLRQLEYCPCKFKEDRYDEN